MLYFWVWTYLLPRLRGYAIRQTRIMLDDGALAHKLVRVPDDSLEQWDAEHDVDGNKLTS